MSYQLKHDSITHGGGTKQEWIDTTSSISFNIKALANVTLHSLTIYNVTSYKNDDGIWQSATLYLSFPSITPRPEHIITGELSSLTFDLNNYELLQGRSTEIRINRQSGYYSLLNGVTVPTTYVDPITGRTITTFVNETNSGLTTTNSQRMPLFTIEYDINDFFWRLDEDVNDGFPYIQGLATEYGEYNPVTGWKIDDYSSSDPELRINNGYPYLEGLATDYGEFIPFNKSNWYYNGKNCVVYLNGKEVSTFINGKE